MGMLDEWMSQVRIRFNMRDVIQMMYSNLIFIIPAELNGHANGDSSPEG